METGLSGANKTNSSQSGRDLCFNSLSLTAAATREWMFCFPQNANTLSEAHERDVCVRLSAAEHLKQSRASKSFAAAQGV
jgi:hypothetical protein